jgi:hypothetical protein
MKYLIQISALKNAIDSKKMDIIKNPPETESERVNTKWQHFLPPIVPFSILDKITSSEQSAKLLIDELFRGNKTNPKQRELLLKIQSLILLLSYGIVERINAVVKQQQMLLTTKSQIPFLENVCCDIETNFLNPQKNMPLFYFAKRDRQILTYIKQNNELDLVLEKIHSLKIAPLLFYKTEPLYPIQTGYYAEPNTIKRAYIHSFFDNGLYDHLQIKQKFPFLKPPPINYSSEWEFSQKLEFFNREYSAEWTKTLQLPQTFEKLQQYIHNKNQIKIPAWQKIDFLKDKCEEKFKIILQNLRTIEPENIAFDSIFDFVKKDTPMDNKILRINLFTATNQLKNILKTDYNLTISNVIFEYKTKDIPSYLQFLKSNMYYLFRYFPNKINYFNDSPFMGNPQKSAAQWNFSFSHYIRLNEHLKSFNDKMIEPFQTEEFVGFLADFKGNAGILYELVQTCPEHLFDTDELVVEVYQFFFIRLLFSLFETAEKTEPTMAKTLPKKIQENAQNKIKTLKTSITDFANNCLQFFEDSYHLGFKDLSVIVKNTRVDVNNEKEQIIENFRKMTRDVRNVEKLLKSFKLGKYNVGKEIFILDKKTYEKEVEQETVDKQNRQNVDKITDKTNLLDTQIKDVDEDDELFEQADEASLFDDDDAGDFERDEEKEEFFEDEDEGNALEDYYVDERED